MKAVLVLIKQAFEAFIDDDALSRGAAIAFYTVTSIAPVLFIVVAIAGAAFGEEAARGAIAAELGDLMGRDSAELVQNAVLSMSDAKTGSLTSLFGVFMLLIAASGMFGEMQSALNVIWKASPKGTAFSRLVRARAVSLGLVMALGFVLLVSLAVSAALTAIGDDVGGWLPFNVTALAIVNFVISFVLISLVFAAIYKVLPDREILWRDVVFGAPITALLFEVGKFLIALYLGRTATASAYGAAGSLLVVLLWTYYSAQIFLLGAEFTEVFAEYRMGKKLK